MNWAEIYSRLKQDPNDPIATSGLEQRIRQWARPALRNRGWQLDKLWAEVNPTASHAVHRPSLGEFAVLMKRPEPG